MAGSDFEIALEVASELGGFEGSVEDQSPGAELRCVPALPCVVLGEATTKVMSGSPVTLRWIRHAPQNIGIEHGHIAGPAPPGDRRGRTYPGFGV